MTNRVSNIANIKSFNEDMPLMYNGLTVIPNKNTFEETLTIELNKSRKNNKGVVLLFIDSDSFSITNDILSFDNNYEFIKIVSKYFKADNQNKGLMYRLNENKSLIALYDIDDINQVKNNLKISFKNLEQLTEFTNDGIYNNGYVGISIYPDHGHTAKELINNSNIAMYKAKELGKNKYCFYEDSIYKEMAYKKEMTKDLRHALENNEFIIHYQPQVDIKTNKIYGVEALIRWNSSKHGYMPPIRFIPLAEESGLIIEMGKWILRESCIQAKKWQKMGLNIKTSINISAIQLQDESFLDNVKEILNETNVDPSLIDFEITESILIDHTKDAQRVLNEIKNMGVKISLDDFGTGYSSLIYLNMFPIDTIKIDKSFIQDLVTSSTKVAIIEGIIYIAQNIGMDVTAEGIECTEELELLKEKNCNNVQGYLYSKPLPINELETFLNGFTQN
jgi:diguanylate cyclase (GGDEF)-like protein